LETDKESVQKFTEYFRDLIYCLFKKIFNSLYNLDGMVVLYCDEYEWMDGLIIRVMIIVYN